jgi:uncharacterized protein (DUF427 family)
VTIQRVQPAPGQESVWDYPRPPALAVTDRHVVVVLGGEVIADTTRAWRVCETSHPPVYYVPREDVVDGVLRPSTGGSHCEWKGDATYWNVEAGGRAEPDAAWSYESPTSRFAALAGAVAFSPSRMDRCTVDGEIVRPQAGGFYGGWITDEVVGPFKGDPGTLHW